ncbi:MAG: pantoate--beta-alanine ligase [Hydrogenophilales bacterium RIFOXYD1_FULL_62_11]|nr:MAG: pantoate--beta-alanine ligase [Hydrogenophilales bacterium RIFOXYD1_FULL_62_11]
MQVLHTVAELRTSLAGKTGTAFVPTMGNLHAGHVSLVELAKQHGQPVVASIFVNPLQFGAGEDFERYPRTLDADCNKLAAAGCDIVFAPAVSELYPVPQSFTVQPSDSLTRDLDGAFRPGHFNGVATVVLKLFNLVQPRVAVFGKKDCQQLLVIRELVRQFNLPIEIVAGDTLREADGLAMSSRNGYLDASERIQAVRLQHELATIRASVESGERDYASLSATACRHLKMAGWRVDYIELRDAMNLQTPAPDSRQLVVLGAAWLGKTRLIDNLDFDLPAQA